MDIFCNRCHLPPCECGDLVLRTGWGYVCLHCSDLIDAEGRDVKTSKLGPCLLD
jgi:hypothetical protein